MIGFVGFSRLVNDSDGMSIKITFFETLTTTLAGVFFVKEMEITKLLKLRENITKPL
jgi:hypothetical protein